MTRQRMHFQQILSLYKQSDENKMCSFFIMKLHLTQMKMKACSGGQLTASYSDQKVEFRHNGF